jgi:homoserine dehydrogenase
MEQVNVGIIGFGTVGAGTVDNLLTNKEIIANRVGCNIVVKKIADLDLETDRGVSVPREMFTTDASELIKNSEIDIVVELMGGLGKAKEFIIAALKNGKHVVTANKALLAEHGKEIYETAEKNNVSICFEASVGGGIPVIRSLREGLSSNRIRTIMGILNGTSNYILTKMTQEGISYNQAVEEAIDLGYAEDPPDLDVDGTDAAHKLAILISLSFGTPISFDSIYREGINCLTPDDINFAKELGYCLKLLAVAKNKGDGRLEARVHPAMVSQDHIMANVHDAFNAIFIEGDFAGPTLYYGYGAGRNPTGSAVVSDIISIARHMVHDRNAPLVPPLAHTDSDKDIISIQPIDELKIPYYFRFSAVDKPGVLSKIAGVLGDNNISVSSVIQKGREVNGPVPIVMLTHEALESDVKNAMILLNRLDVLIDKTMVIRVVEEAHE